MKRFRYDPALAAGSVAAGGGLGILIPPSIALVVYGLFADQSIGRLLLSGVIPGILQAFLFMLTIYTLCRINPLLGPPADPTILREKIISLKYTWPVIVIFAVVMGGIYLGITTPTEAGGIGAFAASLINTVKTTAFILFIIMRAVIFCYFLTLTRIPTELACRFWRKPATHSGINLPLIPSETCHPFRRKVYHFLDNFRNPKTGS